MLVAGTVNDACESSRLTRSDPVVNRITEAGLMKANHLKANF
jgi:hypothetical protein